MKKVLFSILAVSMLLIWGCSPYTLQNSTVYNDANVGAIKTFRIATPENDQLPPKMSMTDYYNISNAIRQQLTMRGFTETPDSPILVNFGLTVETNIQTQPALPAGYWPGYWNGWGGWRSYWIYPRSMYLQNYYQNAELITGIQKEGVLTIDMVNTADKSYVWSASVSSILTPGNKEIRNNAAVQEIVALAFKKFPVSLPGAK
ncbi:MAG: DUF4136 domain-containing protein [Bacteroidales bacterium]